MFSGNTAGKFGAVIECRCVAVAAGRRVTLRVTTSRYRWLACEDVRSVLKAVTASLRLLPQAH
eukprot:366462-Chlamydomonas_euryale.AAC.36